MDPKLELNEDVVDTPVDDTPVDEPVLSETEKQALETGWVPKDQWKGAEEDWVPAKAYLKYGTVEAELKRIRSEASQKEKVIKSMKDYYLNVKEDAKKEVMETLKRHKREAIKNEDYAEVAKIDVQIDELTDNIERRMKQHDTNFQNLEAPQGPPPEFYEWNQKNSWYTFGGADELTKEADALAVGYYEKYPGKKYSDMLNYVTDRMKKLYPEKFQPAARERPADVNEPGDLTDEPAPRKGKYKLTAAEKEAAAAFDMTEAEYAAELQKWEKSKGWA